MNVLQSSVLFTLSVCRCLGYDVSNECSLGLNKTNISSIIKLPYGGVWTEWKPWSECNQKCISRVDTNNIPIETRTRYCFLTNPNNATKYCGVKRKEFRNCTKQLEQCPEPVDGSWTEWSGWSVCPAICRTEGEDEMSSRMRACMPQPLYGGETCPGNTIEHKKCSSSLARCDTDGAWSEWVRDECILADENLLCSEGYDIQRRSCDNPTPHKGAPCFGVSSRVLDCWSHKGCPVSMQSPQKITHLRFIDSLTIFWWRPPYGEAVKHFIVSVSAPIGLPATFKIPLKSPEIFGEYYNFTINELESPGSTYYYSVTSYGYNDNRAESKSTIIITGEIDGAWGNWGYWSTCSVTCNIASGDKIRRRYCNNPKPSARGNPCPEDSEEFKKCHEMISCN